MTRYPGENGIPRMLGKMFGKSNSLFFLFFFFIFIWTWVYWFVWPPDIFFDSTARKVKSDLSFFSFQHSTCPFHPRSYPHPLSLTKEERFPVPSSKQIVCLVQTVWEVKVISTAVVKSCSVYCVPEETRRPSRSDFRKCGKLKLFWVPNDLNIEFISNSNFPR